MPASMSTSRSKPTPVTRRPRKPARRRRNAWGSRSMIAIEWPLSSRMWARVEPTRPQPMITICILSRIPRSDGRSTPVWRAPGACRRSRIGRGLAFRNVAKASDLVKRLLVGRALRSGQLHQQLLPKRLALPVFASDALSSVAYAPQEILVILSLAGVAFYSYSPWIALAVIVVMLTVVASYRQNVHAYPSGGGDYEVATTNLGQNAGLTVASALMVDYVLTVAVSVANGVDYVGATIPFVARHKPAVAIGIVILLMLVNLRGLRESGL